MTSNEFITGAELVIDEGLTRKMIYIFKENLASNKPLSEGDCQLHVCRSESLHVLIYQINFPSPKIWLGEFGMKLLLVTSPNACAENDY
jgi:hypothetical protein